MNKVELKKIIYDFNGVSSRLLKAHFEEYNSILGLFIRHIEGEELIYEYVKNCGEPTCDVSVEVGEVSNSHGRAYFYLGSTEQEEVAIVYGILKFCWDQNIDIVRVIARSYSTSRNWQDMVRGFNERVVMVLVRHIQSYLVKIGIDMGMDETVKYAISVSGGQVNVASGNAVISATQTNSMPMSMQDLRVITESIRQQAKDGLSGDEARMVDESLDEIENELASSKPRRGLVNTLTSGLQNIKGPVEFMAAVAQLVQFVQSFSG